MKVISPLADMDIELVSMKRHQHMLILCNDPDKEMPVQVSMHPRDVARLLWMFLKSPANWVFVCTIPFFWAFAKDKHTKTEEKYPGYYLNYPW